jgi:hypothetical protein
MSSLLVKHPLAEPARVTHDRLERGLSMNSREADGAIMTSLEYAFPVLLQFRPVSSDALDRAIGLV